MVKNRQQGQFYKWYNVCLGFANQQNQPTYEKIKYVIYCMCPNGHERMYSN